MNITRPHNYDYIPKLVKTTFTNNNEYYEGIFQFYYFTAI